MLATYALPMMGVNFAMVLLIAYIAKYSTDVLLVAPAAIGTVFGLSRLWDAVTDPVAGYLSDRTHSRVGRRRPWLIASALPLALFGLMAWSPPAALGGTALVLWMAVAIFGFNTATTAFLVPHQALGAELSDDHHLRTRIFARRQQVGTVGMVLALVGGTSLLANAEDPRTTAFWLSLATGGLCLALIVPSALALRERDDYRGRGARGGLAALRDVWRNPHARLLYGMIFVEHMGSGASMVLAPYLMHYVLGLPGLIGVIFAFYTGSTLLSISLWLGLSRRIGKKRTWLLAMAIGMLGYALLFTVGEGDLVLMCFVVVCTGAASGCGTVIGSSILADVVDFDELQTGERKEGAYYSLYTFLYKTSSGVMAMVAGLALDRVGFVPNVEQTEATKLVIRSLMAIVPLACIAVGAALFTRFRLTEPEHARVRARLADRRPSGRE